MDFTVVGNGKTHWSFLQTICLQTSEANPTTKNSIKLSLEPWNVIHHANCKGTAEQTHQIKSCKSICGHFPSLQSSFLGASEKTLDGMTFPKVSVALKFQLSISLCESRFSKSTPRHLRESGHFPLLATLECLCFPYIPAAIESQSGTIPHKMLQISIQSTRKGK